MANFQDERCLHKRQYTKKEAQTIRNQRLFQGEKYLRIYPCPLCNSWHLTHKNKERENFLKDVKPYKREWKGKYNLNFEE